MHRLEQIKETLLNTIQSHMNQGLSNINTKELGEAIDMLKDMEQAMYYCSIVKAMKENKEEEKYSHMRPSYLDGKMYYDGNRPHMDWGRSDGYYPYPTEIRDYREGKSPVTRRMYMESKELHHDKSKQMQELDKYMKELTDDILEMINDATPEEKQMLSQKLSTLANKVQ